VNDHAALQEKPDMTNHREAILRAVVDLARIVESERPPELFQLMAHRLEVLVAEVEAAMTPKSS
jgi:hypothetical protein